MKNTFFSDRTQRKMKRIINKIYQNAAFATNKNEVPNRGYIVQNYTKYLFTLLADL
jgi:hypothetical protein